MSLNSPSLPGAAIEAFQRGLPDFFETDDLSPFPADLTNTFPLQLYNLSLRDIVNKTGLTNAVLVGWRVLADGGAALTPAAASVARVGESWSLASVSRGPGIDKALYAARTILSKAGTLPQVAAADYESRLLSVPGLLTDTFWLKSFSSAGDLVIPYDTLIRELDPTHAYGAEEFLTKLRPLAQSRLDFAAKARPDAK
jgi:hypothetical protein